MTNNDDFNHDLNRRLSDLGGDLTPVHLPGAAAARNRAAQRSRHQVLGSVAAGVAVVVGVVVFRAGVVPADNTEPIKSPSSTETITSAPPSSPESTAIPDDALMHADDIFDEWPEAIPDPTWEETTPPASLPDCVPDPSSVEPTAAIEQISFASTNDAGDVDRQITQELMRVGNAVRTFEVLHSQISECDQNVQDQGTIQNVGEQAWVMQYLTRATGAWVTISLAQHEDVISLITKWQQVQDLPDTVDYVTPARAADQMCTAIFGKTCAGDAEFMSDLSNDNSPPASEPNADPSTNPGPTEPTEQPDGEEPSQLAANPFLTENEINPVGNAGSAFAVAPEGFEANPPDAWCLDDPNGVGAKPVLVRYWDNDLDAHIGETILQFADSDDASNYLLDYANIPDRCGDVKDGKVDDIGALPLDSGDDALAWSVFYAPPEAGTSFMGAAMAQRGNIVVLLTFGAMSDPGDWEGYVTERLGTALDRAIAD